MRDQARASAWRAVALMLGTGWVVLACGGGDDGGVQPPAAQAPPPGQRETRQALPAMPPAMHVPGVAVAAHAVTPCPTAPVPLAAAAAPTAAGVEPAVDEELSAAAASGRDQHAGSVEVGEPFDSP